MPLFADANVTGTDIGLVILTVVNVFGGALTLWITRRFDAKITTLENDLRGCKESHATAERASAAALSRVAGLESQNGGQQVVMDKQQAMISTLTERVVSLVGALQESGIPAGSGPLPALPDSSKD